MTTVGRKHQKPMPRRKPKAKRVALRPTEVVVPPGEKWTLVCRTAATRPDRPLERSLYGGAEGLLYLEIIAATYKAWPGEWPLRTIDVYTSKKLIVARPERLATRTSKRRRP